MTEAVNDNELEQLELLYPQFADIQWVDSIKNLATAATNKEEEASIGAFAFFVIGASGVLNVDGALALRGDYFDIAKEISLSTPATTKLFRQVAQIFKDDSQESVRSRALSYLNNPQLAANRPNLKVVAEDRSSSHP